MYECNGYMCGGKPEENIKVTAVKALDDMIMLVTFSNSETRLFDASVLEGPVFEPLKDDEVFKACNIEFGVVTWKNGEIDCAPEFMYEHSYEYARIA